MRPLIALVLSLVLAQVALAGGMNQYHFFDQYDWGTKTGIYFQIHHGESNAPATLAGAHLDVGIGDGKDFGSLDKVAEWQYGKLYTARLVYTPAKAQLFLDGELVAEESRPFTRTANQPAKAAYVPDWGRGDADYTVEQRSLVIAADGKRQEMKLDADTRPPQLRLLSPSSNLTTFPCNLPDSFEIEATFQFNKQAQDAKAIGPFVDRYFQSIQANYPGKVRSDEDLKAAIAEEDKRLAEWESSADVRFDRYGGLLRAFTSKATGFYRVEQRDGKWWLITPEGNPCFYTGMCSVPGFGWGGTPVTGREFLFQWLPSDDEKDAWSTNAWSAGGEEKTRYVSGVNINLKRKYGDDWQRKATESAVRRVRALGFSGIGKWSNEPGGIAHAPVIGTWAFPKLVKHIDPFSSEARAAVEAEMRKQVEPRMHDPFLLGWSWGNEFPEHVLAEEVTAILKMDEKTPARQALVAKLREIAPAADVAKPTPEQIESLRLYYQDKLYEFVYATIKKIDPNHLFLATWVVPNWWVNEADWFCIGKHCDVLGFDYYQDAFTTPPLPKLIERLNKPVICGEFSYAPYYDGTRGFSKYGNGVRTEADTAGKYTQWMKEASANPWCVGTMWFEYRDEPLTGRGPVSETRTPAVAGENYAFGIVDEQDRIRWTLAAAMRDANLHAAKWRLAPK